MDTQSRISAPRNLHPASSITPIVSILLAVSAIYGARLGRQPIVGEESRWATAAREMLATGDWIVPRQQGRVFPERPPMTMWAIAVAGWLRGDVDAIAVRLPSVIAVVLTSLFVYAYASKLLSRFAAMAAALVYATFGQVLQIGRLGESEALFTLLVSGSLLVWHLGYLSGWSRLATWSCGFGLAALAALVKGPQAPAYFVAITCVYLILRRDWRYALCWQYATGLAVFAAIVGMWQVPFYLATDWLTVVATWSGLAADRIHLGGLLKHVLTYPLETFACLLPWSPLLLALAKRETRVLLRLTSPLGPPCQEGERLRAVTTFLLTALVVAYPTVLIAAGARGRYFMPLYPVAAVLIGLLIERCATAQPGCYPRRAWRQFLLLTGTLIVTAGAAIGGGALLPTGWGVDVHQPLWFAMLVAVLAASAAYMIWNSSQRSNEREASSERLVLDPRSSLLAPLLTIAAFVGVAYAGVAINVNAARWNDPTSAIASLKERLPDDVALVSLSPIEHRFAYYYREPIAELDWPEDIRDLPPDVEYFCFMRYPGDTRESRAAGRGRTWSTTPGTLPFAWEEIESMCVERRVRDRVQPTVVLGRVVRPLVAEISDVTVPRSDGETRRDRETRVGSRTDIPPRSIAPSPTL